MSKEFAMLAATRKLEGYISREQWNLRKMAENSNLPATLVKTKADQHNELVSTLNELFVALTGGEGDLFPLYQIEVKALVKEDLVDEPEERVIPVDLQDIERPSPVPTPKEDLRPTWQKEGYPSEDAWIQDKRAELVEQVDDVTTVVDSKLAQHRMTEAMKEYEDDVPEDISEYDPEMDEPIDVLSPGKRPTEDVRYFNHTPKNVRLDSDPAQIVDVETAVELAGEGGNEAMDLRVDDYVIDASSLSMPDMIDEDISELTIYDDDDDR